MTVLATYDRILAQLMEATQVSEVLAIRDQVEHIKLHARQIKDRELLWRAIELQMRAERELGVMLVSIKEAGQIQEGRRGKKDQAVDSPRVTLEEIGVTKALSSKAQRAAAMHQDLFESSITSARDRIRSGKAITVDPISDGGVINGARAIMGSRVEPSDSLDYFPTPPWATRALIEKVLPQVACRDTGRQIAWEPACGEGHMAEVLAEYFA
jgi:hypothetical protein